MLILVLLLKKKFVHVNLFLFSPIDLQKCSNATEGHKPNVLAVKNKNGFGKSGWTGLNLSHTNSSSLSACNHWMDNDMQLGSRNATTLSNVMLKFSLPQVLID